MTYVYIYILFIFIKTGRDSHHDAGWDVSDALRKDIHSFHQKTRVRNQPPLHVCFGCNEWHWEVRFVRKFAEPTCEPLWWWGSAEQLHLGWNTLKGQLLDSSQIPDFLSSTTCDLLSVFPVFSDHWTVKLCDLGMPWGQNEFENMPATFEATEEEKTKFPNPEDLQLEQLSCIYAHSWFSHWMKISYDIILYSILYVYYMLVMCWVWLDSTIYDGDCVDPLQLLLLPIQRYLETQFEIFRLLA